MCCFWHLRPALILLLVTGTFNLCSGVITVTFVFHDGSKPLASGADLNGLASGSSSVDGVTLSASASVPGAAVMN